jgi:isoquinoline 1-oxidoreductase beta subunit
LRRGEIAAFAKIPAQAPQLKPEDLKKLANFRLITKDVMRADYFYPATVVLSENHIRA